MRAMELGALFERLRWTTAISRLRRQPGRPTKAQLRELVDEMTSTHPLTDEPLPSREADGARLKAKLRSSRGRP